MTQDTKCAFGLHKYEVYKEHEIKDYNGDTIMQVIVNRCSNCGKLHANYVDMRGGRV